MKIYLQDCQTGKFMRCDSAWTADISEALDFLSERRAILFGMTELKASFQILKIATAELLPVSVPRPTIPQRVRATRPERTVHLSYEQIKPLQQWQPLIGGSRVMSPGTIGVSSPLPVL